MNMNIQIKKLEHHQVDRFIELIRLFEDVFEMKDFVLPPKEHLQRLLNQDTFFVFVAMHEDIIIGGLTAYTWDQYYSTLQLVYVFDLAVKREYQRKGIGKMLMEEI